MPKEILLYQPIYSSTAIDYINQMEANKGNDVSIRMNCPGGNVYEAYGMIAKFNEHTKGKSIKVDGMAKSGGFYLCCAANDVECLEVTDFMAHRAALPDWIESDPKIFTPDLQAALTKMNGDLRGVAEAKVSATLFQAVTGVSYDTMFSLDGRVDVKFNAEQAKRMGLVKRVVPLTATKKTEIVALAASCGIAAFSNEPEIKEPQINTAMEIKTLADFKAQHPGIYAEAIAAGAADERDRVESWMAYNDIDPVAVKAGIESGKDISRKQASEFNIKAASIGILDAAKADNIPVIVPPATGGAKPATAAEKNTADFLANCKADLGIK